MEIPIGCVGEVLGSGHAEHMVRVDDDQVNTGGFLVLQRWRDSRGPNADGWFDDWVQDREQLAQYFRDAGWQIVWQAQGHEHDA